MRWTRSRLAGRKEACGDSACCRLLAASVRRACARGARGRGLAGGRHGDTAGRRDGSRSGTRCATPTSATSTCTRAGRWTPTCWGATATIPPWRPYRFGRGEEVTAADSRVHRLRVPLDFMAVTDHGIWLGEVHLCEDPGDAAYDTPTCEQVPRQRLVRHVASTRAGDGCPPDICGQGEATLTAGNRCYERSRAPVARDPAQRRRVQRAGALHDVFRRTSGRAFPPGYGHLHRNVIFRGDAVPEWGGSAVEMGNRPERLWEWLEAACTSECQVVAIPHNSKLSGGPRVRRFRLGAAYAGDAAPARLGRAARRDPHRSRATRSATAAWARRTRSAASRTVGPPAGPASGRGA